MQQQQQGQLQIYNEGRWRPQQEGLGDNNDNKQDDGDDEDATGKGGEDNLAGMIETVTTTRSRMQFSYKVQQKQEEG
jgi:hypothetical protein